MDWNTAKSRILKDMGAWGSVLSNEKAMSNFTLLYKCSTLLLSTPLLDKKYIMKKGIIKPSI